MRKVWNYFMAFCDYDDELLGPVRGIAENRGV